MQPTRPWVTLFWDNNCKKRIELTVLTSVRDFLPSHSSHSCRRSRQHILDSWWRIIRRKEELEKAFYFFKLTSNIRVFCNILSRECSRPILAFMNADSLYKIKDIKCCKISCRSSLLVLRTHWILGFLQFIILTQVLRLLFAFKKTKIHEIGKLKLVC